MADEMTIRQAIEELLTAAKAKERDVNWLEFREANYTRIDTRSQRRKTSKRWSVSIEIYGDNKFQKMAHMRSIETCDKLGQCVERLKFWIKEH